MASAMTLAIDHTHAASARSWLASANVSGGDFPIQNLPFAVFRHAGSDEPFRGGVAIGDRIIDMQALAATQSLAGPAGQGAAACALPTLNAFFGMGPTVWKALRHALFEAMRSDAPASTVDILSRCLVAQRDAEFALPVDIGDYTDFYTSIHHATNIGKLFRPDNPLAPNFHWVPVGYHGRVSSIGISGQRFHRPWGQIVRAGRTEPVHAPCERLDYELELGIFIGVGNTQGEPIALSDAEQHVFGLCLLNDWSARDIQVWESAPLGPFLAKNFATTVSPWIVTMEALAPYRQAWTRSADLPQPLAYLEHPHNREGGAIDVQLAVSLETAQHRATGMAPSPLSRTSFRHQHWSVAQMVAHHSSGGCNLRTGDLLGSGTISGPTRDEAGALIELTRAGREPLTLDDGQQRSFLHDGDAVIFSGWCEKAGFARIGFGCNRGEVLPAHGDATANVERATA